MGQSLMKLFFDSSCHKEVKVTNNKTPSPLLSKGTPICSDESFLVNEIVIPPTGLQIYVVDSMDRDRIGVAREEFQAILKDPLMLNSVILVLANKQDTVTNQPKGTGHVDILLTISSLHNFVCCVQKGAMKPPEVAQRLGLYDLKNRTSRVVGACALTGEGLHEGLGWLAATLKDAHAWGSSVRF
ncbi:hypothetical protein HU200_005596 [Digitaria exilis]|uniref:ADP-ribosylation factor n=1 Tax=Digitaria exilis TaxID=1010633 RepID=A0A835FSY5_9POAL|nr:hypothetical protein HU200_005596 [Digitaria exilis]